MGRRRILYKLTEFQLDRIKTGLMVNFRKFWKTYLPRYLTQPFSGLCCVRKGTLTFSHVRL